jgi:bifunctional non-homologous end joining protein LigD
LVTRKDKREGKVFIDYIRNSLGQTSIAPYSLRPTSNASIATPLHWDELTSSLTPDKFHLKNIFKRLAQRVDPWHDLNRHRIAIPKKDLE